MKAQELRALFRQPRPVLTGRTRSTLDRWMCVDDAQAAARRVVPRPVYDYIVGGSEGERTIVDNVRAFDSVQFVPRALRGVSEVDTRVQLLAGTYELPLVLGPTGFTRMIHPDGELAVARAAHQAAVPYALSTYGTTRLEDMAASFPKVWFQLYLFKDWAANDDLIARVRAAGYDTLVLTVDTTVAALRTRDRRNGFSIPPALTVRSLAQMAVRPKWCAGMLATDTLMFQNLPVSPDSSAEEILAYAARNYRDTLDWDDVSRVRAAWPGQLVIKGLVSPDDVVRAAAIGADAVLLSNHGGRQLDGSVSPLDLLPVVRDRVGPSLPIIVDSGVRRGADIAAAVALGADACAIGRAYLYGLAAAGQAGVARVLELLGAELRRTMGMLGVASIDELRKEGPELLRMATRSTENVRAG